MNKSISLIVKVTNACNLHCRYCFIEPNIFNKTMRPEMAKRIVHTFLKSSYFENVSFIWHGGEPLLRGREFFADIFAEQQAIPTKVRFTNLLQTNATHLSDDMLDFLSENDVHIGLSLDGSQSVNDGVRHKRNNGAFSAYNVTVDAARRIQARGRQVGAIAVINAENVAYPEDMYTEFKREGINMKITPLTRSGLSVTVGKDLGISAEQYGTFMVRLFNIWFNDPDRAIVIEPFQNHIVRLLGVTGALFECHFAAHCHHSFLGISPDGDLYPCGMFQGEQEYRYGNIKTLQPEEIHLTALFGRIDEREHAVAKTCAQCLFFDMCYSGCMFHSLKDSNRFEEKDFYCAGYKMYFEHLLRSVHADLTAAHSLSRS